MEVAIQILRATAFIGLVGGAVVERVKNDAVGLALIILRAIMTLLRIIHIRSITEFGGNYR